MAEKRQLVISCEHGGNQIPAEYRGLFLHQQELLGSHRGYDAGALALAKSLACGLAAPLKTSETSRLLVDLNRSPGSRQLFSVLSRLADRDTREQILRHHYQPYRAAVAKLVNDFIAAGSQVVHLSVHSFTPELNGRSRNAAVGLLYDPTRTEEKLFCQNWQHRLKLRLPNLQIRRNYPYRGTTDGLAPYLRAGLSPLDYLGIELEVNQALLEEKHCFARFLSDGLGETLEELLPPD